ncbi:hypothetical protein E2562_006993 [Oryza meyeriana var. granulata]|uniref:Uncharacterized protein n=1 Tax=Oryza meyeriana var. granulata TaxID=110450 RepID=A0A6G1E9L9_9ORYZ|nr:hypothetical protein E2562_006993 [Oryza meyeriana var. granulata]
MALNMYITNTCTRALLLLAILVFSQLSASQGRPLPDGSFISAMQRRYLLSHGNGAMPNGMVEGAVFPSSEIHGDNGPMADVDDVRPTNPGHSPGIGHAFVNENADVDDVRPTNPGHSPGIGHAVVTKNADVDGVRPTNPGHSPGIGHAVVNKNGPAGKKL